MGIGLSGMVSGLDTDSIVKAMVSGQQAKATKVENKITLNKWTKEAWSGLNTKIYSFYTKYASKLRLQTSYMTRTASSSNESIVKATAGSGAAVGTHTLQVKKLASSQYVTGAQLKKKAEDGSLTDEKANYNKNTKLKDLVAKGTILTIKGQIGTEDEEVVKLEVNDKTTINDFLNACKDAGLTASFDTNQQRFFISSSESGLENKFSITTSALSESANTTFDDLDKMITKEYMTSEEKEEYEDAINTLRTNTDIIEKVLSEKDYDAKDKTQKAVKDAIATVEKFAVEHMAETEAIKRAELVQYGNPSQEQSIDDVISSIFSSIPAKSDSNSTTKEFEFYGTEYSMKSLAELKETAINNIKTQANKDATAAINALKLGNDTQEIDGVTLKLSSLTKEQYTKAVEYLKEEETTNSDGTTSKTSAAQEARTKAMEAYDTAVQNLKDAKDKLTAATTEEDKKKAQEEVDKANDALKAAEEKVNAVDKSIDEGKAIIKAWENTVLTDTEGNPLKVKDAAGNEVDATLATFYQQEYEKTYKEVDNTPSDLTDDNFSPDSTTNDKIRAELKNLIISKDKTEYDAKIEEIKNKILTVTPDDNDYSQYAGIVSDIDDRKIEIKDKIETLTLSGTEEKSPDNTNPIAGMGLSAIDGTAQSAGKDTNGDSLNEMVVVEASDAKFVLDGAEMIETSNSFTVNGLTLNLSGTTGNETDGYTDVQITVGKDVDSTYKLVKEAITEYNKLLEEMNTLYNADSARGYDPLTDEQKESMSETDIENWEKKIKDSLLRRDDTLGSLLTGMRNALATSYTDDDGKTYSLSTYGIVTGNYTEKGKLHIYGDEEDGTYATYTDRLKAALEDDPDKVMETLTHVFGNLYSTMTEKCAKTEISSALTFYNDKQYNNLLKDYEDDLDILEDRIKELEDRYYKQFTAMETAMSKLQNQSNSLASLLGTGGQ